MVVDDGFSADPPVPSSSSTAIRNPFCRRGDDKEGGGRSSENLCVNYEKAGYLLTFSASKVRNIASLARKHCANNSSLNRPARQLY